jgi:hypothetical protein
MKLRKTAGTKLTMIIISYHVSVLTCVLLGRSVSSLKTCNYFRITSLDVSLLYFVCVIFLMLLLLLHLQRVWFMGQGCSLHRGMHTSV